MDGKTALAGYVALGFFLNSFLHTWYVSNTDQRVRFALPFSEFGAGLPPWYGYVGAVIVGVSVFWATWLFVSAVGPLDSLEIADLLPATGTGLILLVGFLPLSQYVAGASWSKLALDGLVVLTGLLVLFSHVRLYSLFELVGTYITILGFIVTLGAIWLTQYVEDFHGGTFPSAAYFGISALYLLVGSIYLIFQNVLDSM